MGFGDILSGAASGATAGSTAGPWGALAGLLLGGGASGLSSYLKKPGRTVQTPTMTPEQIQRANTAGQLGLNQIQNPYQGFEPIAQNAISKYQQQVIPGLAERFTSMGKNLPTSGAFTSQLNQAGNGLQESLAAMQAQYGLKQQDLGRMLMGLGQQSQFENNYFPSQYTGLSGALGPIGSALGGLGLQGLSDYFGGQNNGIAGKTQPTARESEQQLRSEPITNPQSMQGTPQMANANLKPFLGELGQQSTSPGQFGLENLFSRLRGYGEQQEPGMSAPKQLTNRIQSLRQNYTYNPTLQQMVSQGAFNPDAMNPERPPLQGSLQDYSWMNQAQSIPSRMFPKLFELLNYQG